MSLSFIYGDKLRDIANRSETSKGDVTLNCIVSQLFALIINNPSRGTVHGQQNNSLRLQANKCSLARPLHIRKLQKRACQETLQGNHTRPGCDNIFQKEVSSLKSSLLKSERNDVYRRFNCVVDVVAGAGWRHEASSHWRHILVGPDTPCASPSDTGSRRFMTVGRSISATNTRHKLAVASIPTMHCDTHRRHDSVHQ